MPGDLDHYEAARLGAIAPTDTIVVGDSRTYTSVVATTVDQALEIHASNEQRPLIRQPAGGTWTFTGKPNATLLLDGLFVSGGDIVLDGDFDIAVVPARQEVTARRFTTWSGGIYAAEPPKTKPLAASAVEGFWG